MMLFSQDGNGSILYMYLLPIVAALLGGSVFAREKFSGRLRELEPRPSRSSLLNTSLCSGFILGGLAGVSPLLINLVFAVAKAPHMSFISGRSTVISNPNGKKAMSYVLIEEHNWAYPLYKFSQPLLVVLVFLSVFVVAGLLADIAVGASFFSRYKHVELLVPFVLFLIAWYAPEISGGLLPYDLDLSYMEFLYVALMTVNGAFIPSLMKAVVLPGTIVVVLAVLKKRRDDA
ncbi:hypothetical protein [Bifidobacterium bohemicum]|nr:hypothetical protein [Bifidobacterium bohemicum]